MQVGVLVGVSDRAVIAMVPPVGDEPPPPPPPPPPGGLVLVVDPCVVGDGQVVGCRLGQEGRRERAWTRLLVRSGSR